MSDTIYIVAILAPFVLFLIRMEIVYRIRGMAINEIFARRQESIERGDVPIVSWDLIRHNAEWQIVDLRKWTFAQFYPELTGK